MKRSFIITLVFTPGLVFGQPFHFYKKKFEDKKTHQSTDKILVAGYLQILAENRFVRGSYLAGFDEDGHPFVYDVSQEDDTQKFQPYNAGLHGKLYWYPVDKIKETNNKKHLQIHASLDTEVEQIITIKELRDSTLKDEQSLNQEEFLAFLQAVATPQPSVVAPVVQQEVAPSISLQAVQGESLEESNIIPTSSDQALPLMTKVQLPPVEQESSVSYITKKHVLAACVIVTGVFMCLSPSARAKLKGMVYKRKQKTSSLVISF